MVLPIGGEQGDNARRIQYLGVGRQVDTENFTVEQLRAVVEEMRGDPTFPERAGEIRKAIAATQGPVTASRCVARIARSHAPLERPDGVGPTIGSEDVQQLIDGRCGVANE